MSQKISSITVTLETNPPWITLNGEFGKHEAPLLASTLERYQNYTILVDFTECPHLSAEILPILINQQKERIHSRKLMLLLTPQEPVRNIFRMSRLDMILAVEETRESAIERLEQHWLEVYGPPKNGPRVDLEGRSKVSVTELAA